ncbi:LysR family transcriptional regulator [Bradyrhizobium sp.]|uniref:LysR family transcriptional regulator n=1 Tax=Bradyrhizobium sp. TaxID=376 RepID=UPI003C5B8AF0
MKVFEAVLRHRRVSSASKELGVTASAVSHAVGRLRRKLDDPLFHPGVHGMEPTSRALELGAELSASLGRILDIMERRPFDAAHSRRVFNIAASEYAAAIIAPPMIRSVTDAAPGVSLRIHALDRSEMVQGLDEGRLSFALGWFTDLPARLLRATVLKEREAILVRSGHPLLRDAVTSERLLGFPHLVALFGRSDERPGRDGGDGASETGRVWIERLLAQASSCGRRHVAVKVAQFAVVPALLASSDMVATLPRRIAIEAARGGHLVMLEPASPPLEIDIQMVWHERAARDAGSQWLMRHIQSPSPSSRIAAPDIGPDIGV